MQRKRTRLFALLAASLFLLPYQTISASRSYAASLTPIHPAAVPVHSTNSNSGQAQSVNLNLNSTHANISAPNYAGTNISIGASAHKITSSTLLTPAEYLAVNQVVTTGTQSLILGALGNAIGGSVTLNTSLNQIMQDFSIPHNVRTILNFTSSSDFNLNGTLQNSGSLYAVSSNSSFKTANINAQNIINQPGATISTVLPAGGFSGLSNLNPNLSLTLTATNSILNQGQISSAANLTLRSATLVSSSAGLASTTAQITAAENVSLYSSSGVVTNSGLISSTSGSVSLNTAAGNDLVVHNYGGTIQALSGAINLRDASYVGSSNITVNGGNLLANQINLNAGAGAANMVVDNVQGTVNVTAAENHIVAATNNLVLGNINVSGDPSFYNTATNGDITIAGDLTFGGQDLAIVAEENVVTSAVAAVNTSSSSGRGGDITIIAGANVTASGTALAQVQPVSGYTGDANITLTISGASSSGGYIDLTGAGSAPISSFNSSSTAGRGGNVTLAAFYGSNTTSGVVTLPTNVTITTGGAGNNPAYTNGNVLIIAGAQSGNAVTVGPINTSNTFGPSASTQTGSVDIVLSQPALSNNASMVISGVVGVNTGGTVTSGALIGSNSSSSTAAVSVGNISIQSEAGFSISTPQALNIGSLTSNAGGVIAAGYGITGTGAVNITTAQPSGLSKQLQIDAGSQLSYSCAYCSSTTPGVALSISTTQQGGNIDFSASPSFVINTTPTATNANGGNVSLISFANGTAGGSILLPSVGGITTSGSGNGIGGNIWLLAGQQTTGGTANITAGPLTGNQINIFTAQPVMSLGSSVTLDDRGQPTMILGSNYVAQTEGSFVPGQLNYASTGISNVTLNGSVNFATRFNVYANGIITAASAATNIAGSNSSTNGSGGNLYMSGSAISIAGSISTNGNGSGYAGNISLNAMLPSGSTNTSGNLSVQGNISATSSTGSGGSISLAAANGSVTAAQSGSINASGGVSGGNVTVISTAGITLGSITTSASTGAAGTVIATTGAPTATTAALTTSSIWTTGVTNGGLVMLVNSSPYTSANNLTVNGTITTDASGLNGVAGPVSIVATGELTVGNISAQATGNNASTAALGGSVFISSGGTGTTAINAGTIDTSATSSTSGNLPGNIILLTAAATTGASPTNITTGTLTTTGHTNGAQFAWGLSGASKTISNNQTEFRLNVTPTPSINITPGGYQTFSPNYYAAPLSINTGGDKQLVVPINVGAIDSTLYDAPASIYFTSINQTAQDNIALVGAGHIEFTQNITTAPGTPYFIIATPGQFVNNPTTSTIAVNAGVINIAATSGITYGTYNPVSFTATSSLNVSGDILLQNFATQNLTLQAGGNLAVQSINTSQNYSNPGTYTLSAGGSLSGQTVKDYLNSNVNASSASSFISLGLIYNSGAGASGVMRFSSGAYTALGDVMAYTYCCSTAGLVSINSGSFISANNIYAFSGTGGGANVSLNASGPISVLNLNANANCCGSVAGTVSINSQNSYVAVSSLEAGNGWGGIVQVRSSSYTDIGDISSTGGTNISVSVSTPVGSGNITIASGSSISLGNINTSPINCCNYAGGDLSLIAANNISYKSITTGSSSNLAGNVYILDGGSIGGGAINTSAGQGGNIYLAAPSAISVGALNASSVTSCGGNCGGGNIVLISTNSGITVNGNINTNSTNSYNYNSQAGSTSITAGGTINTGNINASSDVSAGNIFISSGSTTNGAVTVGTLDTSASYNNTQTNYSGNIFLGANSAGTNGPAANSTSSIIFAGLTNAYSNYTTANPYLFYNSSASSISGGATTVSVQYSASPSSVTIYPGGYSSDIGSAGSPSSLTLSMGDSRTIAPIVSQGNIYLSGLTTNSSLVPVFLASAGNTGIVFGGNAGTAGGTNLTMFLLGAGSTLSQSAGTLSANSLNMFAVSPSSDLGSSAAPINVAANNINVVTGGSANAFFTMTGPGSLTLNNVFVGGTFQLSTGGQIVYNNVGTGAAISLATSTGNITGTGTLVSPSISFTANGNVIASTLTSNITASSPFNVVVNNASALLNVGNVSASIIQLSNNSDINVTGAVAGPFITITTLQSFSTAIAGATITPANSLTITANNDFSLQGAAIALTPGSNNGVGATINLTSNNGNVLINGDINSTPYGTINITTNSVSPFVIGAIGNSSPNGVVGTLNVSGTGAASTGGTINITTNNTGGITVLDPSYLTLAQPTSNTLSVGGNLTLSAGTGPLAFQIVSGTNATLSADGASGGAAGNITLTGKTITAPSAGNILLSINGTYSSTISGITVSTTSNSLQIGPGIGSFSLSGTGGGKSFTVNADPNVTVDMNGVTLSPATCCNSISFTAYNNLLVTGNIDVSGTSSAGHLPSIQLTGNASGLGTPSPFTIGPGNTSPNGVTGTVTANGIGDAGGSIAIHGQYGGITLLDASYLSANAGAGSVGGSILLDAYYKAVTVDINPNNLNANNVPYGVISVDSLGPNSTYTSPSPQISIVGGIVASGGNLVLSANGASSGSVNINGGTIDIKGSTIPTFGSASGQVQVIANSGSGGGAAGTFNLTSYSPVTITSSGISLSTPANFSGTAATGGILNIQAETNPTPSPVTITGGTISVAGGGASGIGGQITINTANLILTANTTLVVDGGAQAGNVSIILGNNNYAITLTTLPNVLTIGTGSSNLQISANGGGGNILLDSQGSVVIVGSTSLNTPNDNLAIMTSHLDYSQGVINVGTGYLQLTPNQITFKQDTNVIYSPVLGVGMPIVINGTTINSNEFDITAGELANTTAATLYIGTVFFTTFAQVYGGYPVGAIVEIPNLPVAPHSVNFGDVTIAQNLDLSRFGNVVIDTVGAFNNGGNTITLGNASLNVLVGGNVTTGTINGGEFSTINLLQFHINSGYVTNTGAAIPTYPSFTVNGPVTVNGAGTVGIYTATGSPTTTGSGLFLGADVGGGANTTIAVGLNAPMVQTGGTITGTNVTLMGLSSIGSPTNLININAINLTAIAAGDVYVNQSGNPLTIQTSYVGGSFYVQSDNPITTVGQISATIVGLTTNAGSNAGITLESSITSSYTSGSCCSAVSIATDGSGNIIQFPGQVIQAPSVYLATGGGNIGSAQASITTLASTMQVNIGTGFSGSAYIFNGGPLTLQDSQAGSGFYLSSNGITLNNLATGSGPINIQSGNTLTVMPGVVINANGGSLTLASPTSINIGAAASLNAASTIAQSGNIYISIGAVNQFNGTVPGGIQVVSSNGGAAYFNVDKLNTGATATVVNVNAQSVIFSDPLVPNAINLGSGVTISARPVSYYLESLDLTNPAVTSQIQALISANVLSGSLQTQNGYAYGGTLNVPQTTLIGGLGIAGLKIPEGVTVNMTGSGWTNGTLNINAGLCSTCTQIAQLGKLSFPANANVTISLGYASGTAPIVLSSKGLSNVGLILNSNQNFNFATDVPDPQNKANTSGAGRAPIPCPQSKGGFSPVGCSGSAPDQSKGAIANVANQLNTQGGTPCPTQNNSVTDPIPPQKKRPSPNLPQVKNNCNSFNSRQTQQNMDHGFFVPSAQNDTNPVFSQGLLNASIGATEDLGGNCHFFTIFTESKGQSNALGDFSNAAGTTDNTPAFQKAMSDLNFKPTTGFDPCNPTPLNVGDVLYLTKLPGLLGFKNGDHSAIVLGVDQYGVPTKIIQTNGPGLSPSVLSYDSFLQTYNNVVDKPSITVYSK